MPLIPFKEMLEDALTRDYAVGYFEAWNEDSLEAILSAAEETKSPIILGFGSVMLDQEWFDEKGLECFAAMGELAVAKSKVPVCFILNEARKYEQCIRGIDLGFNVVMMDTSYLPFRENLRITRSLAEAAHARDVAVEAELGQLPEAGKHSKSFLTDPGEAKEFIRKTDVDALSVSIGNVHVLTEGEADIHLNLLKDIKEAIDIPLVIHGGTGFPKKAVKKCIRLGVAKFNVGTILKQVYYRGIKDSVRRIGNNLAVQEIVGSRKRRDFTYLAKQNVKEKVKEFLQLYDSAGKSPAKVFLRKK